MPRVNLESRLFSDPRLIFLQRAIVRSELEIDEIAHLAAIGLLAYVWHGSQAAGQTTATATQIDEWTACPGSATLLLQSRLIEQIDEDEYRIRGNAEQIVGLSKWLDQKKIAGKKSGEKRKMDIEIKLNEKNELLKSTKNQRPPNELERDPNELERDPNELERTRTRGQRKRTQLQLQDQIQNTNTHDLRSWRKTTDPQPPLTLADCASEDLDSPLIESCTVEKSKTGQEATQSALQVASTISVASPLSKREKTTNSDKPNNHAKKTIQRPEPGREKPVVTPGEQIWAAYQAERTRRGLAPATYESRTQGTCAKLAQAVPDLAEAITLAKLLVKHPNRFFANRGWSILLLADPANIDILRNDLKTGNYKTSTDVSMTEERAYRVQECAAALKMLEKMESETKSGR